MAEGKEIEKTQMYLPLAFWSKILITLDRKIYSLSEVYGFGEVGLKIVIRGGKVKDVVFNDEFRLREDLEVPKVENAT